MMLFLTNYHQNLFFRVFYMYTIIKVRVYLHTTKKFEDTCVLLLEFFLPRYHSVTLLLELTSLFVLTDGTNVRN